MPCPASLLAQIGRLAKSANLHLAIDLATTLTVADERVGVDLALRPRTLCISTPASQNSTSQFRAGGR